eukprot:1379706-Amorphochlora_amoeboformis.AAC.1
MEVILQTSPPGPLITLSLMGDWDWVVFARSRAALGLFIEERETLTGLCPGVIDLDWVGIVNSII